MADPSVSEKYSLERKWTQLLEQRWMAEREALVWVINPAQGYVGSVVNQRMVVPHVPMSEVREMSIGPPHWPLPSEPVANGTFLGDEWADDPSVMWWVVSPEAGRDAVLFGDHFAAAPGRAFLTLSTSRLAVVVDEKLLATEKKEESTSGGLFGRAKAAVDQARRVAEGSSSSDNSEKPVSYFEVPIERIADIGSYRMGVSIPRASMLRIDFTDGSMLFVRTILANLYEHKFQESHRRPRS